MHSVDVSTSNKMTISTFILFVLAYITMKEWATIVAILAAASTFIVNLVKVYPVVKEFFKKRRAKKNRARRVGRTNKWDF